MTILNVVYASAPAGIRRIETLEILNPAIDPIRVCRGWNDETVILERGEMVTFQASGIEIALPESSDNTQQTLRFGIDGVSGEAQQKIQEAIESGQQTMIVYREYLSTDLTSPAMGPLEFTMTDGTIEAFTVTIEAEFYDLLNTAWQRRRYTANFAPALAYMQ